MFYMMMTLVDCRKVLILFLVQYHRFRVLGSFVQSVATYQVVYQTK